MRQTQKEQRDRELAQKLGAAAHRLREQRDLSLEALAHRAGLDKSQLSKIERGTAGTSVYGWADISRALGLTLGEFFTAALGRKTLTR